MIDMDFVSDSVFKDTCTCILTSVLEERFQEIESLPEHQKKALLAVINRKDVLTILSSGRSKSVIFQLLFLKKGYQKLNNRLA